MSTSPLRTKKFLAAFLICWLCWAIDHAYLLTRFGLTRNVAILDSAISNVLLGGCILVVTIILQFYIPQKKRYDLLGICLALTILWIILSRYLLLMLINTPEYEYFFSKSIAVRITIGFLVIGCMSLISVLWYSIHDQRELEKRKSESETLSKEAELYKLRQQLQPHFLFNSLNSINALIGVQPQKAREMILQLSDFLRGTLKKEENQPVNLEEELQHLLLYLEIEKLRFGHRLTTNIKNETVGMNMKLPAMLLQPIVENAIKFGLYDTIGDIVIHIEAKQENNNLIVQIINPFDPETSLLKKGTGFGLTSVQRRLYLLFARNDLLYTETKDALFITTIKIPQ